MEFEYYFTLGNCVVEKLVKELEDGLGKKFYNGVDGYVIYAPPTLQIVSFKKLSPEEETKLTDIVHKHKPVVYRYLAYKPVKTKIESSMFPPVEVTTPTQVEVLTFDEPQDIKKLERELKKKVERYYLR